MTPIPCATTADYLAAEVMRRSDLRDSLDRLATHMPRRMARAKWWLLTTACISAAFALAAFVTMQAAWPTKVVFQPSAIARGTAVDARAPKAERLTAVAKLVDTSELNVDALVLAATSEDHDVASQALRALAALRLKLGPK